ncbi:unnamed protein product [Paramecium primaurelia]|uniref:Uncharacterized protein n=1 Tax=Paramecium primaurelia TaxID=5886 RepID=A0A8S1MPT8_PARPR|nr:unnamed protein product [Paramecium primaurelia]
MIIKIWKDIEKLVLNISLNFFIEELQNINNRRLLFAYQTLFDSQDLKYIHLQLFNSQYLAKTSQFTMVRIMEAKSYVMEQINIYPSSQDTLLTIIESIIYLAEQEVIRFHDQITQINKKDRIYENLLRKSLDRPIEVTENKSKSVERPYDYSYNRMMYKKLKQEAFKMLSTSVDIEDANAQVDNYKLIKSTDTTNVPLRQMPKSSLHNYYVTQILKPVGINAYKLSIMDIQKNKEIYFDTFKNQNDCLKIVNEIKSEYKIQDKSIQINKTETKIFVNSLKISTPKLGEHLKSIQKISPKKLNF